MQEGKAGYTPLHLSIAKKDKRLFHFIVSECPNLNLETQSYSRLTAYQYASDPAVRQVLINKGAVQIDESDDESSYSEDDDSDSESDVSILLGKAHTDAKRNLRHR